MSGWIDAVSDFNLLRMCFLGIGFVVPKLGCPLRFAGSCHFLIRRVPSKSNGYAEKVGGYKQISVGTLYSPNDPPCIEMYLFLSITVGLSSPITPAYLPVCVMSPRSIAMAQARSLPNPTVNSNNHCFEVHCLGQV